MTTKPMTDFNLIESMKSHAENNRNEALELIKKAIDLIYEAQEIEWELMDAWRCELDKSKKTFDQIVDDAKALHKKKWNL